MTISDFKEGTTYIKIKRNWFKCEEQFEDICKFLELPEDCLYIELEVAGGKQWNASYKGLSFRGLELP